MSMLHSYITVYIFSVCSRLHLNLKDLNYYKGVVLQAVCLASEIKYRYLVVCHCVFSPPLLFALIT